MFDGRARADCADCTWLQFPRHLHARAVAEGRAGAQPPSSGGTKCIVLFIDVAVTLPAAQPSPSLLT